MFPTPLFHLVLVLAALVSSSMAAEISFEELKSKLPGHTVALRLPLKGSEIFFDLDGKPIPPYLKGTMGRDGFITVSDIRLDDNNVILTGHRALLISFAANEPLHLVKAKEKVTVGFVVPSSSPQDVSHQLELVIHPPGQIYDIIAAYNLALKKPVMVDDRQIATDCKLQTMATPITRTLVGKKIQAIVIANEYGEPDALALRSGLKRGSEKEDAVISLFNWRFAPVRFKGKLVSCTHAMTIDTTKISLLPRAF